VLFALAKDTGGKALVDYNDLSAGVQQAATAQTSYYIIGYYSNHAAKDGKYRRVQVRLSDASRRADLAIVRGITRRRSGRSKTASIASVSSKKR
jgi:hypothetical protein